MFDCSIAKITFLTLGSYWISLERKSESDVRVEAVCWLLMMLDGGGTVAVINLLTASRRFAIDCSILEKRDSIASLIVGEGETFCFGWRRLGCGGGSSEKWCVGCLRDLGIREKPAVGVNGREPVRADKKLLDALTFW